MEGGIMHGFRSLALVIAAATLAACTPRNAPREDTGSGAPAYVRVQNQLPQNYTLYASDGARRLRMGLAGPLHTTVLRIPQSLLFPAVTLRFEAQPDTPTTPPITERITVSPGDTVNLVIAR